MIRFPVTNEVRATASAGIRTLWEAQAGSLPKILSAIPPQFMGPGGGYSPEDLFALAILNCIIATFKTYCTQTKLSFGELSGRAILTADQLPSENLIWMKHFEAFIDVKEASDVEEIRFQLDRTISDCAISNSIKSGKTFHINVS